MDGKESSQGRATLGATEAVVLPYFRVAGRLGHLSVRGIFQLVHLHLPQIPVLSVHDELPMGRTLLSKFLAVAPIAGSSSVCRRFTSFEIPSPA